MTTYAHLFFYAVQNANKVFSLTPILFFKKGDEKSYHQDNYPWKKKLTPEN